MKVIVFDTEGNGYKDEQICQLSYLIADDGKMVGKNFYFRVGGMNKYAQKVHGLSKYALEEKSCGRTFADDADEIYGDFVAADLVIGHHVTSDISRLRKEFARCSKSLKIKRTFCTMRFFNNALHLAGKNGQKKFPRLEELCKYYRVIPEDVRCLCGEVFAEEDVSEHDARYDAAATYLAVRAASLVGDVRGVF